MQAQGVGARVGLVAEVGSSCRCINKGRVSSWGEAVAGVGARTGVSAGARGKNRGRDWAGTVGYYQRN